jgi:hypothetical protein
MKDISFSVSDNNYTIQARTNVSLDSKQDGTLKKLVREIERGLFSEKAQYLCIDGLLNKRVVLTITECEDKLH